MDKKKILVFTVVVVTVLLIFGVQVGTEKDNGQIEYLIGISQANMTEPWRLVLTRELEEEADKYSNMRLIMMDAASNSDKQKEDVNKLLEFGVDLLIISPDDVEEMTQTISEVYQRQIPVIVMDKAIDGFDYTLYIGPDNQIIGKQAADSVLELMNSGRVLEICGKESSQASRDKSQGFAEALEEYHDIEVIKTYIDTEYRDEAEDELINMGTQLEDVDVIFAHNDFMAWGASNAISRLGYDIKIIGIDGFTGENNGLDLVKQGKIHETIACSTGGKEAIQNALDILREVSGVPKQIILRSHVVAQDNLDEYMAEKPQKKVKDIIDVGYCQVGTESAFRLANTDSIKSAAQEEGINLIFEDADQQMDKQIKAVRRFIDMEVDVIVISPIVEHGWTEVLLEAQEAGIPVMLSDRKIEAEDDSLIMTYIGADFIEEGKRALRWIVNNVEKGDEIIRIMELRGTDGSSPTTERNKGFEDNLKDYPQYQIVYSETGDFTYEGGKEIIENYLKEYDWDIDVIFAHNDDMALGAIDILEEKGLNPGVDVKIVSVDGTREAFEAMIKGQLNCAVECNPLLGPQLMKAIQDYMSGKELPLRIITEEKVYTQDTAKQDIKSRKY